MSCVPVFHEFLIFLWYWYWELFLFPFHKKGYFKGQIPLALKIPLRWWLPVAASTSISYFCDLITQTYMVNKPKLNAITAATSSEHRGDFESILFVDVRAFFPWKRRGPPLRRIRLFLPRFPLGPKPGEMPSKGGLKCPQKLSEHLGGPYLHTFALRFESIIFSLETEMMS